MAWSKIVRSMANGSAVIVNTKPPSPFKRIQSRPKEKIDERGETASQKENLNKRQKENLNERPASGVLVTLASEEHLREYFFDEDPTSDDSLNEMSLDVQLGDKVRTFARLDGLANSPSVVSVKKVS